MGCMKKAPVYHPENRERNKQRRLNRLMEKVNFSICTACQDRVSFHICHACDGRADSIPGSLLADISSAIRRVLSKVV